MNQSKLKLLYLLEILWKDTDEEHTLTVPQLISRLEQRGISAERRSVYDDIQSLRDWGLDILERRTRTHGYYLASRTFELPELKLLVDAVQSSRFITVKKSQQLIKKIGSLTSRQEAGQLSRQVYVANRVKTGNEGIYYNVDEIHKAISQNRQISFQYAEYTLTKGVRHRRGGERYLVSPYILSWGDENYYLIAYHPRYEGLAHFRVDKMVGIKVEEEERVPLDSRLDPADYAKRTFGMFAGQVTRVQMRFHRSLLDAVIDRFGREVSIAPQGEEWFTANLSVAVSPAFLSWVFQFGEKAEILGPAQVREGMAKHLSRVAAYYGRNGEENG